MIKKWIIILFSILFAVYSYAQTQKPGTAESKVLVVYFSHTGNTRKVAMMIHDRVGGDLFEIQTLAPYPSDYEAVKSQALREQTANFKPTLKAKVGNFNAYRVIYLGYPIWWAKLPPPLTSFLSAYSFAGKTIIPFCTHQGSYFGQTISEIRTLCPQASLQEGLAVWGREADNARDEVSRWLQK